MRTQPRELQALRDEAVKGIGREAADKLKLLLEQRHIYQQVVIDGETLIAPWKAKKQTALLGIIGEEPDFDKQNFTLADTQICLVEVGGPGEERWEFSDQNLVIRRDWYFGKIELARVECEFTVNSIRNDLFAGTRFLASAPSPGFG